MCSFGRQDVCYGNIGQRKSGGTIGKFNFRGMNWKFFEHRQEERRLSAFPWFRCRRLVWREADIVVVVDHDLDPPALPAVEGSADAPGFTIRIPHEDIEGGKFFGLRFSRHFSLSFCCMTLSGDATGRASSRPRRHTMKIGGAPGGADFLVEARKRPRMAGSSKTDRRECTGREQTTGLKLSNPRLAVIGREFYLSGMCGRLKTPEELNELKIELKI